MSDAAAALLADLQHAYHAAASVADREPLGVRAVEWAPGSRGYLCAFEDGRFLCLDEGLAPVSATHRLREIAGTGLLWEQLEEVVDPERYERLASAIGRLLATADEPRAVVAALAQVAERAAEMSAWRTDPARNLASLVALDEATALHDRLHAAYGNYLHASEPLVERQDELDGDLVARLRDVEQAAGWAGLHERLADTMARAMAGASDGADQVLAAHLTPLAP